MFREINVQIENSNVCIISVNREKDLLLVT